MTTAELQPVWLCHCPDYSAEGLEAHCRQLLERLCAGENLCGAKVLLKPNLISSRGPALACTSGHLLAAVARWFLCQGAQVRIGDSPAFGSTRSVLARQAMMDLLAPLEVELVDFRRRIERRLANGLQLGISADALECDLFVNLPKLKAHNQMYITGAVKNIFGIVVGMKKAMLHMRHGSSHLRFAEIILGLAALLPRHISLLDGVEVMHCSGPVDGRPLALGCLGGARNPVALDTAVLQLLELPAEESPLWQVAAAAGCPGSRGEEIVYPLENPCDFAGSGFLAPAVLNSVRFHPARFAVNSLRKIWPCQSR